MPGLSEPVAGFAEEHVNEHLPPGYGYPIKASDVWAVNYMLHNETPVNRYVYITYTIDVVPMDSPTGRQMIPAHPLWIDTRDLDATPLRVDYDRRAAMRALRAVGWDRRSVQALDKVAKGPLVMKAVG